MVNMAARLFLDKNDYHLIKNVTIPAVDGTPKQRLLAPNMLGFINAIIKL